VQSRRFNLIGRTYHRIAALQLICLVAVVALVWICERLGLHTAVSTRTGPGLCTLLVIVGGVVTMIPVLLHRKDSFNGSVTICSYCRRVQVTENEWDAIENFLADRTLATYSHGACPDCRERVMNDYRAGKKDAGAKTAVMAETLV
jgi:hypothetical protein